MSATNPDVFNTHNPGVLCNIGYPSETHLNPESRETSFAHDLFISYPIVLLYSVQYFKPIGQLEWKLWRKEFSETSV